MLARLADERRRLLSTKEDTAIAARRVRGAMKALARGDRQTAIIQERDKRGRPIHKVEVDIRTDMLKDALSASRDGADSRLVAKHMKEIMRTARVVTEHVVRYTIEYRHSETGRDLVDAGHVTGSRLYATGPDPFKWAAVFRDTALHGSVVGDDGAAFPTARNAMMPPERRPISERFLANRPYILKAFGGILFPHETEKEATARMKQITTAYDMGAGADFWKKEYGDTGVSLKGTTIHLEGGEPFSVEDYRRELERSAAWMGERAGSMLEYLRTPPVRGGRKRTGPYRPGMVLKSYILQEAEAVGREAKIAALASHGEYRVVNLQHDGIAISGVPPRGEQALAASLSAAVSAACGYAVNVKVERVDGSLLVD